MRIALALLVLTAASLHPVSTEMEQKVYLPHCGGGWWKSDQGTDDGADWVVLKCSDSDDSEN